MLNNVKSYGCASSFLNRKTNSRIIFFSDEKNFTVSEAYNRRNARYISLEGNGDSNLGAPYHARYATSTKHPSSRMFLGVVASTGEVSSPIWFKKSERLNANKYIRILDQKLIPWMREVAASHGITSFTFQQDGAPAHTATDTQNFLKRELGKKGFWCKKMWPPNSPDLNPLDYSIWNEVASRACSKPHPNIQKLKATVNRIWKDLDPAYVSRTCQNFRKRLLKVVEVNGGYIE